MPHLLDKGILGVDVIPFSDGIIARAAKSWETKFDRWLLAASSLAVGLEVLGGCCRERPEASAETDLMAMAAQVNILVHFAHR